MKLHSAMSAHRAQRTASHRNRVAIRAFERLAALHQAVTDPGAYCDINKNTMCPAGTENSFAYSCRANVRFHLRGSDFGQPLLNRAAAPVNCATAGDIALA